MKRMWRRPANSANWLPAWVVLGMALAQNVWAAGDMTLPKFEQMMARQNITMEYSQKRAELLYAYLESELQRVELAVATADEPAKSDLESEKELYQFAKRTLKPLLEGQVNHDLQRVSIYVMALRKIYSAQSIKKVGAHNARPGRVVLDIISRSVHEAPYTEARNLDKRIGLSQAKKEAKFLVSPSNPHEFVRPTVLATMTTNHVSNLDISESHPLWYTRATMAKKSKPWADLENWVNQQVKTSLENEGQTPAPDYNVSQARRVLIFTGIKTSATSPKISARDVYGLKWKVKWGSEVHTEPLANRLYVKLGAKYQDLVYANARGVPGLVLVLERAESAADYQNSSCERVVSVQQLQTCLLGSQYRFNLAPYIYQRGTLTKDNEDEILVNIDARQRAVLRDRQYVTFYESSAEFHGSKVLKRGGPIAGSLVGAADDRVARGLFLFNMWIKNIDAKDENNKGVILKNFNGQKQVYVETQHDLGSSLGAIFGLTSQAGNVNGIEPTFIKLVNKYAEDDPRSLAEDNPRKLRIDQQFLYKPVAWDMATHADILWMAKQICQLSGQDIGETARATEWPQFMVEAMTYKLVSRRNQICQVYGLRAVDMAVVQPPSAVVGLRTGTERAQVAREYGISWDSLEAVMMSAGLIDAQGTSSYVDVPLANGVVTACDQSVLINLIEKESHPAGLSRRVVRHADDRPLPECVLSL